MTKLNYSSLLAVTLCVAALIGPLQASEEKSYFTTGCKAALGALSIAATAYYARNVRTKQLEELDREHAEIVNNNGYADNFETTEESNATFAQKPQVQALEQQRSSISSFLTFARNDLCAHLANTWSWAQNYWNNEDQSSPRDPAEVDVKELPPLNITSSQDIYGQSAPVQSPCRQCFTINGMKTICPKHQ